MTEQATGQASGQAAERAAEQAPKQVAGQALVVRPLGPADAPALLGLHAAVFGSRVDGRWYGWKYRPGLGSGSGVWFDGQLVAHCGGIARTLWVAGERVAGLQIGDVMVQAQWRGVMTRRGPFYYVSQHFYEAQLGADKPFQLGFGFPGARHLKLAVAVKLLRDGGGVQALHWDTAQARALPAWQWRWQPLAPDDARFDTVVGQAWDAMRAEATALTLGERDAAYLRWRYLERPDRQHHFVVLRRPWSRVAAGVAVLDLSQPEAAHWLDWVGPPSLMATACRACCHEARQRGKARLEMWASEAVVRQLAGTPIRYQAEVVRIGIVNASALPPEATRGLDWWLVGGDTDFL